MKALLLCAAVLAFQMNALQEKPVVHLGPHQTAISIRFGGKLLELINAPIEISLPKDPPKVGSDGEPWSLDIRNLGPALVTVTGHPHFSVSIGVGRTVHVIWNGNVYSVRQLSR